MSQSARVIQRCALSRANRQPVAFYAERSTAVVCGVSADAALDECWRVRDSGGRRALLLREFGGRKGQPTAVCLDSRTLQSTPESGARAGYDGAKRRKGSKVHIAVDTLGQLMALKVTPANQGDCEQVAALAEEVQQVTENSVDLAYVDQGYTGPNAAEAALQHGMKS
jgi:hypothetical protein